jgi:hypothetical protein
MGIPSMSVSVSVEESKGNPEGRGCVAVAGETAPSSTFSVYRGTSLMRNTHTPRIHIGP